MARHSVIMSVCTINFHHQRNENVKQQASVIESFNASSKVKVQHVVVSRYKFTSKLVECEKEGELPSQIANSKSLTMRRNFAKSQCQGEYMWLMDDDVQFTANGLIQLVSLLKTTQPKGIVIIPSLDFPCDVPVDIDLITSGPANSVTSTKKLVRLFSVLRSRSIELVLNLKYFQHAEFDEQRGIGVNDAIGAEALFCFSYGVPPVTRLISPTISFHHGESTGKRTSFKQLYRSNHIQSIMRKCYPWYLSRCMVFLYFLFKRFQLWKRG